MAQKRLRFLTHDVAHVPQPEISGRTTRTTLRKTPPVSKLSFLNFSPEPVLVKLIGFYAQKLAAKKAAAPAPIHSTV